MPCESRCQEELGPLGGEALGLEEAEPAAADAQLAGASGYLAEDVLEREGGDERRLDVSEDRHSPLGREALRGEEAALSLGDRQQRRLAEDRVESQAPQVRGVAALRGCRG